MLREPCPHGRYDAHLGGHIGVPDCPGGRPLSDAEALERVLYTDCGECEGDGIVEAHPTPHDPSVHGGGDCPTIPCRVCGGSGRVLRDGVQVDAICRAWLTDKIGDVDLDLAMEPVVAVAQYQDARNKERTRLVKAIRIALHGDHK